MSPAPAVAPLGARCTALVRLAPSFGPVGNRVSHGTERNPAVPGPAAAGEPVHGLQEPLRPREAVPCPAPPALAVDRTGLRTGQQGTDPAPDVSPRWGTARALRQPPIWLRGVGGGGRGVPERRCSAVGSGLSRGCHHFSLWFCGDRRGTIFSHFRLNTRHCSRGAR